MSNSACRRMANRNSIGEPHVARKTMDRVQQHHPLDGAADAHRLPMTVVGLPEGRVQRLVVDVEDSG